ncbi:hypothetical protein QA600_21760 [Natronococcus sp. A-GB1]|uniref:hypothetical protein n=1 Tax=Natronococcus sp. A-GB1 TaxID=3037648 RepID=UPI00241FA8F9|nr:hypothetical protein [Natronococcus sp. A-GB1]MDG5761951.1 hypothetical protein [Natronococcus sp. A-GB1]
MTQPQTDAFDEETAAHVTACRDAVPTTPPNAELTFGFDGFIDNVRELVDVRHDAENYTPMRELGAFGDRIRRSADADSSVSTEWHRSGRRAGGHVAHLSRATGTVGFDPTMLGTFGIPSDPVFDDEFEQYERYTLGEPTITDAVEFDDGKLLLQETGSQRRLNWERLCDRVGIETLADAVDGATVLGIGYWANIPELPTIWNGLATELWPLLSEPPESVFLDPADIRQLSTERLRSGLEPLAELDDTVPVTVSANRAETAVLARPRSTERHDGTLRDAAERARDALGVTRYAAHSSSASALAGPETTARVAVPQTDDPVLTTSAGDHFTAGLVLAHLIGITNGPSLVLGNALAGHFVRNGAPPTYEELLTFVDRYATLFD